MRITSFTLSITLLSSFLVGVTVSPASAQDHNHGSGLPHNIPDFCSAAGSTVIPSGSTTTWTGTQSHACVGVRGTLVLSGQLTADIIMVYEGGHLDVQSGASIVFRNTPLNTAADPEQFGTGMLVFGRLRMLGTDKTPYVRTAAAPLAGQTTVTLASAPSGWTVGDEVFLPDTRQVHLNDWFNAGYALRHEIRTITAISGSTVTLNAPLSHDHRGARNADGTPTVLADGTRFLPHLANLTRSIVVRSASPTGTRGHVLATHRASVEVRGVAFRDLGRTQPDGLHSTKFDSNGSVTQIGTNQVGRYPLHIHHLMGPVNPTNTGYQFRLVGNVIRDSRKWPMAIHASHYGLIENNVIVGGPQRTGSGLALEDGSETENLVRRNFVADIRGDQNSRHSGSDTNTPGTGGECIWAAGFNNRFVENVVAGCRNPTQQIVAGVGFKFYTPAAPSMSSVRNPLVRGANMQDSTQTASVIAQRQPILQFEGNEAYGLMADGLTIWHLGTDGYQINTTQAETLIKNFRVWHAYEGAIWNYPTNRVTVENLAFRYDPPMTIYAPTAVQSGDYRTVNLTIRGGDIHAGGVWNGWDPIGTVRFVDVVATTSNHAFQLRTPATPGSQASHAGQAVAVLIERPRISPWPSRPYQTIALAHNTSSSPYDTTSPYSVYVTDDQGIPGNSYRAYFAVQGSQDLYGGKAPCADTTSRQEVAGITCGGNVAPPPSPPPPPPPPPPPLPPPPPPPPPPPDGTSGGGSDASRGSTPPPSSDEGPWVTGDYDGDGRADLSLFRPSSATWYLLSSKGGFKNGVSSVWGVSTDVPVAGDYDGDLKLDMAVYRPSNGAWHIRTSSSNFASSISFVLGVSSDVPVPADYDGDGRTDIAVFRPSNGRWYVRRSSSNFTQVTESSWGTRGDVPAPADYDGDGRADFAVFRPNNRTWNIRRSADDRVSSLKLGRRKDDIPVPADYDGDGKADMALYSKDVSGWSVSTSSTNFRKEMFRASGRKGDVPVALDANGDGKTDFVAFHPPTGGWYVLTSTAPFQTGVLLIKWGQGGDIPLPLTPRLD